MSWRSGHETALELGRLCGAFRGLHHALGMRAPFLEEPAQVVFCSEWARLHAWHAELLFERLPLRAGFDRESVCTPGDFVLMTEGLSDDEFLVVYRQLLSRIHEAVVSLGEGASPASERSVARAARLVLSDLEAIERDFQTL